MPILHKLSTAANAAREGMQMRNRWTTGLLSGLLTVAVLPVSPVSAVSGEVIGYGQGTAVDSENRPVDAVAFDAQYARYDAYATTPDRSQILLTFDQGYENGYTGQILDTLREKQVHAVFFLTGDYAKKETDLVNRMIAEGHVLGNHGMTHASLPTLSDTAMRCSISAVPAGNTPRRHWKPHRHAAIGHCSGAMPTWTGKPMPSRIRQNLWNGSGHTHTAARSSCCTRCLPPTPRFWAT